VIRSQINLMGNRRYWICFFPGPDPKRARVTNVVFPEQMSVDVELMNKLNVQAQKDFED